VVTVVFHKDLTPQKWASKPFSWQILSIASELGRAESSLQKGLLAPFKNCLERGLELIDLTVEAHAADTSFLKEFLRFREVLATFYADPTPQNRFDEFRVLTKVLLTLEPEAYNLLGTTSK
jgi:hypothetical protein